ncbi:mitochondrial chaperone bcs1 [Pyrenophora seminiperda CCB06]|uniref:Mitochondrial chaperone bcs1 n=1 Tax=Pyrenophora seminiperda CCB06 TaxID=1302712 RepID=A0A3M7M0Y9_9PLEO|nr:mitochondrial chaperone bcs1 [Pyrenophora seminiperda CCB06]
MYSSTLPTATATATASIALPTAPSATMGFSSLLDMGLDDLSSSSSSMNNKGDLDLTSLVLNQFFPGFGLVSDLLARYLGVDVSLLLRVLLFFWALIYGGTIIYSQVYDYVLCYFVSTMHVSSEDDLFETVMAWVAAHSMTQGSREIKAGTDYQYWYSDDENEENDNTVFVNQHAGIFNYSAFSRNIAPRYEPSYGNLPFRHNGRWFMLSHTTSDPVSGGTVREKFTVRCLGRSTQPLKDLLADIKNKSIGKQHRLTVVWRPTNGLEDRYWERTVSRATRPISTVSLDLEQKVKIVRDINEYLQPETARWYAARGIPHRRGYLFHGPPGTGKTSLSFALAGIFGLDVYSLSLNEAGITETSLNRLFKRLPRRCVVLLEDIDSAGLRREDSTLDSGSGPNSAHFEKMGSKSIKTRLSTWLGPGCVHFTLATRDQIREMFVRMYSTGHDLQQPARKTGAASGISNAKQTTEVKDGKKNADDEFLKLVASSPPKADAISLEDVTEMASRFAEQLPENTFSPAEVQGYLLKKKNDPVQALEKVAEWRDNTLAAKKKGAKVLADK